MIHRVVFGSIERFIGVITEHFAGAFPTWLAPVQVKVLPITDRAAERCVEVQKALEAHGVRVETDLRNEKIGFKIREAQMQKIPYMLVLGDKEVEQGLVSVRSRKDGDLGTSTLDDFTANCWMRSNPRRATEQVLLIHKRDPIPGGCPNATAALFFRLRPPPLALPFHPYRHRAVIPA